MRTFDKGSTFIRFQLINILLPVYRVSWGSRVGVGQVGLYFSQGLLVVDCDYVLIPVFLLVGRLVSGLTGK